MQEFLEYLLRHLVEHPDDISIETTEKDDKTVFIVSVHESDLGKIIGRKGRTIYSLRTLLSAVSARENKRAIIEIKE